MSRSTPHTLAAIRHISTILREAPINNVYEREYLHAVAAGAAAKDLDVASLTATQRHSVNATVNRLLREAVRDGRLSVEEGSIFTIRRRTPDRAKTPNERTTPPPVLPVELLQHFTSEQLLDELARRLSPTKKDS